MSEQNLMNLTRRIIDSVTGGEWPKPQSLSETANLPWWVVLANRIELARRRIQSSVDVSFHIRMAYGSLAVLIISFVGCRLTSIHTDISGRVIAIVVMFAIVAPLPIYL